jgi:hypothetical protein
MFVNGTEEFEEEEKPKSTVKQVRPNTAFKAASVTSEKSRAPPPPRDVIQLLTSETSIYSSLSIVTERNQWAGEDH